MLPYFSRAPYDLAEQEEFNLDHPSTIKRHSHPKRKRSTILLLALLACFTFYLYHSSQLPPPIIISDDTIIDASQKPVEIPNIVHFVRQLNRYSDGTAKPLEFEFRHFLAYYSAHHYLQPEEINIWSDVTEDMIETAKIKGNQFTKAVLNLPNLHFRHVTMPNQTTKGVAITKYAHKSDFIRTRVMATYGGQYFDDDSWIIRDLKPLRKAGFENVFGKEWGDDLCQAAWMSTPNNALMKAFARLQETEFNGDWLRASNNLISNLVYDVRGLGHDQYALVLERNAFFPGQWNIEDDGLPMFYKVHKEVDDSSDVLPPSNSVDELVNKYHFERHYGWRKDWRNTYIIHGFSNAIRDANAWWMFEPYGGFTPEYVLSRTSNIARALYPALKDAIDTGILKMDDNTSI